MALDPKNTLALTGLAGVYDVQGKPAEAEAAYRQALALGDDPLVRQQLAGLYERQGQNKAAAAQLEKAVALDGENVAAMLHLAALYGQMNRLDDAAALYGRALVVNAESAPAQAGLAAIEYKRCNLGTATQAAGSAAALAPAISLYRGIQASLYEAQGRNAEAASLYDGLRGAPPTDALAHLLVGSYLARQQADKNDPAQADAAEREFQVSQESAGGPPAIASLAHLGLGQLYTAQGKLVAAQNEFAAALRALPANADAQASLGDLSLRSGDAAAALAAYDRSAGLLPAYTLRAADNAHLLAVMLPARRGLALARLTREQESKAAFDNAIRQGQSLLDTRRNGRGPTSPWPSRTSPREMRPRQTPGSPRPSSATPPWPASASGRRLTSHCCEEPRRTSRRS